MNRYNNGKVYKLVNNIDNRIYVGSTCMPLAKRLYNHKTMARNKPSHIHRELNTIGWENVRIILIEIVNAQTKDQLLMREQFYIDLLNPSLNKQSAIDTCTHGRHQCRCKECGGVGICQHNRKKQDCKECGGSQICQHNRKKQDCKECGGVGICQHNRRKRCCKECGGSQICHHNRRKQNCKECLCDKYYCYECCKNFSSNCALNYHMNGISHKQTYKRLMKEVFDYENDEE
jgi:hypothetical protein